VKAPKRTPCSECPWRRVAPAGWLGPETAEGWINIVLGDGLIACHMTIPGHDLADMTQCAGAAIFRANVAKIPRSSAVHKLPKNRDEVFATPAEFRQHHQGE